MDKVKSNLIRCLSPDCCDNRRYVELMDDVEVGDPVELYNYDPDTDTLIVTKLMDEAKLIGVIVEDGKQGEIVPMINRGDLYAKHIKMPSGLARNKLEVERESSPLLNLIKGL